MSIENRGRGKWQVRIYLGRDGSGKRILHTKTITGTKKQAADYEREFRYKKKVNAEAQQGVVFSDFVAMYLDSERFNSLKISTQVRYKRYISVINKHLGRIKISDIVPITISRFINNLPVNWGATTKKHTWTVAKMLFNYAYELNVIDQNPMNRMKAPKADNKDSITVLSEAEIKALLNAADSPKFVPIIFALTTGCRPGEYTGLTWDKVNLQTGIVKIQQTAVLGNILQGAKNKSSIRSFTLDNMTLAKLKDLKQWQEANCIFNPLGLVFPSAAGRPLYASTLKLLLDALLKKAGIDKQMRVYDLRHTNATFLIMTGMNIKDVSARMGHSDTNMTLNVYTHVIDNNFCGVAEHLNKLLF